MTLQDWQWEFGAAAGDAFVAFSGLIGFAAVAGFLLFLLWVRWLFKR